MRRLKVLSFLFILMFLTSNIFARDNKEKEIPPWMEAIDQKGRSIYLIPKGAKRKKIGSQVIIEDMKEYVARKIYRMEERLFKIEERFTAIEGHFLKIEKYLTEKENDQEIFMEEFREDLEQFKELIENIQIKLDADEGDQEDTLEGSAAQTEEKKE